ncbi:MAG: hypothetical protein WC683_17320 [bacterium]
MSNYFGEVQPFASVDEKGTTYAGMNDGITPEFIVEPVKDEAETEKAGITIYKNVEVVRIRIAGDPYSVASTIVDDNIKRRFAAEYARWKQGQETRAINGTPLREWGPLAKSQALTFEASNVFSVEDLAHVSDAHIDRFPDGRTWRSRAAAWLASASDGSAAAKFAAENERLKEQMALLQKQVEELARRSAEDHDGETPERLHWKTRQRLEREAAEAAKATAA